MEIHQRYHIFNNTISMPKWCHDMSKNITHDVSLL